MRDGVLNHKGLVSKTMAADHVSSVVQSMVP
jgi:hypothetical protein